MIRCIAFDAVGTLVEPAPPVAVAYRDVGLRYGSQLTLDEVRGRFRAAFSATERSAPGSGSASPNRDPLATSEAIERERWRTIVASVLDDVSDPELCFQELWNHFARPAAWRCYPEVGETIDRLERAGVRLAIASNFDSRLHTVCDGLPPLDRVELRIVSSEAGWRKPSSRFFEALAEAASCGRDEIVVVGDDLDNDFNGAVEAGMRAVWVQRGGATSRETGVAGIATISDLGAVLDLIDGLE
jgi:putative hydrolase of the HAD superfamily